MALRLLFALLACAACASSDEVVQRNTNDGPIFIADNGDTVRMHQALRIGRLSGPDEYTFAAIDWVLPTPDGGVLLYDTERSDGSGDSGRIRRFDARGRFVRYVGRPGEGPGEYSSFPQGTLLPDGSLLIADQGLARITRYDTAGALIDSWRGPDGIVELQPATDGGWYVGAVTGHPEGKPRTIDYIHYDSTGSEAARFPAPEAYHSGPSGGLGAVDNSTTYVAILPDGRMVTAINDSTSVLVTFPTGETRVRTDFQPVAYLPEEREDRRARLAALVRRSGGNAAAIDIPEFKKAFSWMTTDGSGHIYLRMRTQGHKVESAESLPPTRSVWRETIELEVFDSSLAHRGRLVTPLRTARGGSSLSRDAVWLAEEGDQGEIYLVKWVPDSVVW